MIKIGKRLFAIGLLLLTTGLTGSYNQGAEHTRLATATTCTTSVPDATGDGLADVIGTDSNDTLHIYRGDGHGSLADAGTIWSGGGPWWHWTRITSADFNGDGRADVAGVDPYGDLRVFFGDGSGHWNGGQLAWPAGGNWGNFLYLTSGDFNNDGKADIVAYAGGDPRWYAGDGAGHVTGPPLMGLPSGAWNGFSDIAAGDLNGDGNLDIAALNAGHDIALYLGDGTGHLVVAGAGVLMLPASGQWRHIAAGDYNGDGLVDLAATNAAGDMVLLPGDGTGHLRTGAPTLMWPAGGVFSGYRTLVGTPSSACFASRSTIMPLGDSITWGTNSTTGDGYRKPLADLLNPVTPMGSRWLYEGSLDSGDQWWSHEGHGGWTIDNLANSIASWLPLAGHARLPVGLVLLDAGTNDAGISNHTSTQMLASMSTLLDHILAADPGARILVSQITITLRDTTAQQQAETDFDNGLPTLAASKGANVRVVDMRGVALSADQLHPGDAGYNDMAGRWYAAMAAANWLP
jgi:lysophospholipase L1-like esterase